MGVINQLTSLGGHHPVATLHVYHCSILFQSGVFLTNKMALAHDFLEPWKKWLILSHPIDPCLTPWLVDSHIRIMVIW